MAGACFVAVTQLAVKSDLQDGDRRAMGWFGLALPLLVTSSYILKEGPVNRKALATWLVAITVISGPAALVLGMLEMLLTVSPRACLMFVIASMLMIYLIRIADQKRR